MKHKTQEEILNKLQEYYGKYCYDFSKLKYINSNTPINIVCNKHGEFKIIPYKLFKNQLHLCKKCRKEEFGFRVIDTDSFIKKSNLIHNNYYDYSKTQYTNNASLVLITCLKHGDFNIKADDHLSFQRGCPKCASENKKLTKENVLERFKYIHNNKYIYPNFEYEKVLQKIDIICPKHGNFIQRIDVHLNGYGCSKCSDEGNFAKEFIVKSNKIHNNYYDYSKTKYTNNKTQIIVTCPKHGDFITTPAYHLLGIGCKECSKYERNKIYLKNFKQKASLIHDNKYDYSISEYDGRFSKTNITCPKHGMFNQVIGDHLQGCGCPSCASEILNYSSSYETEIIEFINKIDSNINIIPRYKLDNKEIDIYFPEYKLGIEINGSYWHSHLFKEKEYHKNKSDFFKKHETNIFHIWEHNWVNPIKKEILKSMILNKLNKTRDKVYARKCIIKDISSKQYKDFCNLNHIQGHSPAKIKLGLYYGNVLVACMSFGNLRINLGNKIQIQNTYELIRYCTLKNTNIIGGASKLLKYFEIQYKPKNIVSYADNDYSQGKLYDKLGFINKGFTNLSYSYYNPKDSTVKNRFVYRKSELIKQGYDKNLTEFEITHKMGLYRIFNSGITKFIKELT